MSTHKTQFEDSRAEEFLNRYYKTKGIRVHPISVGEESQAFYFSNNDAEYVLRVSRHGDLEYKKDQIAFNEFASDKLPVPEVIDIGKVDDNHFFIITRRAKGRTLNELSLEEIKSLNFNIVGIFTEIHKLKAPGEGYGGWGLNRNGPFKTWKEFLLASLEQDEEDVRARSFYDASLHRVVKEKIRELISYCPEERVILHGDFGTPNILSDGGRITAVIDWGDSLYGDPLKDVASWSKREGFLEEAKRSYERNGGLPENFRERINCYRLLNTYGGLWFYAYSDQQESYRKCAESAKELIAELG